MNLKNASIGGAVLGVASYVVDKVAATQLSGVVGADLLLPTTVFLSYIVIVAAGQKKVLGG